MLVEHIMSRLKTRLGIEVQGLSPDAMAILKRNQFPGNVRELENVLEGAFIRLKIRKATVIEPSDLALEIGESIHRSSVHELPKNYSELKQVERRMVEQTLKRTSGNKRKAAAELGVTPQTLYNKIAEFDLKRTP